MVEGFAGIGKTKLLQALEESTEAQSCLVLHADASWWGKHEPLHAFRAMYALSPQPSVRCFTIFLI